MKQHITHIASNCFYHFCRLRQIRRFVGKDVTSQLISVFVLARLDYWNSLLAGLYHAPPSNHYSEYRTQLLVWCLILVCVITWHQRWSSYTSYLSNTESNTSCIHWCIKSTLDVHHSTWLTLCNQSLYSVVDPVWGPPTLLTT